MPAWIVFPGRPQALFSSQHADSGDGMKTMGLLLYFVEL